jgi:hypothetical protein
MKIAVIVFVLLFIGAAGFYLFRRFGSARDSCVTISKDEMIFFSADIQRSDAQRLGDRLKEFNFLTGDKPCVMTIQRAKDGVLEFTFMIVDPMLTAKGLDNLFGRLIGSEILDVMRIKSCRIILQDFEQKEHFRFSVPLAVKDDK